MTVPFRMIGAVATLEIKVDGYKVTVSIKPKPGTKMTAEDADVMLTSAVGHFSQRMRFPESLRR